ncbi:MAG: hypothetical protein JWQ04_2154 [Pedosphaera sp.]|nr:hypothetical protein [Pedosphaera sp.]
MNRKTLAISSAQIFLILCAITMGAMIEMSWLGVAGLALVGFAALVAKFWKWSTATAWVGSLLVPASFLLANKTITWDSYYSLPAWLMAAVIFAAAHGLSPGTPGTNWRRLVLVWGFLGSFVWLASSYAQNQPVGFCVGLFSSVVWLVLCRVWFRPGAIGIQALNTLILLFIGLPAVDFGLRLHSLSDINSKPENYYSYEAAQKHPAAYAFWTRYIDEQWRKVGAAIFEPAPECDPPFRVKPGSQVFFFKSPISINRLGFRGREISLARGDAYRIVALGESTTFGATLKRDDRPWPELLEQMIHERLKTRRPVEVINAGVPSFNLETNLRRLPDEVLPVKPDMIISYHGYNGFKFIDGALPPAHGKAPPVYHDRPLKLLGDLEYGVKLMRYKKRLVASIAPAPPGIAPPMETRYARDYRELSQVARTNGIRLVVANYSMAVNGGSDHRLTEFFRRAYPQVYAQIRANAVHSAIVRQLAAENPEICLIDTHQHLDGEHDKFIDLVHLTQPGRQQIAETIFAGIKKILEQDLSTADATHSQ